MKNEELCYRALRKKNEHDLASMPLEKRVDHLVKKHRRSIILAKKHGLNVCVIGKEFEQGGAK
ncbi:MAG: hypothetical protein J6K71_00275 [Clostridia bacterium]|nr:hypothetical protein [Clostridia bacterium]